VRGAYIRSFCGHTGAVTCIRVDKSSTTSERFASIGVDNRIILWHIATGAKLHTIDYPGGTDTLRCVTISLDGQLLICGTERAVLLASPIPPPEYPIEEVEEEFEEEDEEVPEDAEMTVDETQHEETEGVQFGESGANGGQEIDQEVDYMASPLDEAIADEHEFNGHNGGGELHIENDDAEMEEQLDEAGDMLHEPETQDAMSPLHEESMPSAPIEVEHGPSPAEKEDNSQLDSEVRSGGTE